MICTVRESGGGSRIQGENNLAGVGINKETDLYRCSQAWVGGRVERENLQVDSVLCLEPNVGLDLIPMRS